jgi:NADH:ubiquinone oxidoreductase subunit 4 (subunit M)
MFFIVGLIRHRTSSRLGILSQSEGKLYAFALLFGFFLVLNASIPPLPSFVAELAILMAVVSAIKW